MRSGGSSFRISHGVWFHCTQHVIYAFQHIFSNVINNSEGSNTFFGSIEKVTRGGAWYRPDFSWSWIHWLWGLPWYTFRKFSNILNISIRTLLCRLVKHFLEHEQPVDNSSLLFFLKDLLRLLGFVFHHHQIKCQLVTCSLLQNWVCYRDCPKVILN